MAYTETALYCDSIAYTAVAAWATGSKTVGQICRQATAPAVGSERCFVCVVGGVAGATEPAWTTTKGGSTTDNAVTWRECTGLPGLNGDATNTPAWHASAGSIVVGAVIKNVAASIFLMCTTAGTGGTGTEPSWNTTAGATTADGSVTWTCLGAISGFTTKWAAPLARLGSFLNNTTTWLASSGMNIFVGDDHAETQSTTLTINPVAAHCAVLCVDHTAALPPGSGNLKTTATVTDATGSGTTTIGSALGGSTTSSNFYCYGVQFIKTGGATLAVGNTNGNRSKYEQCSFSSTGSNLFFGYQSTAGGGLEFLNCNFTINLTTQYLGVGSLQTVWRNCTFTLSAMPNSLVQGQSSAGTFLIEGCDLSGVTTALSGANLFGYGCFRDCKVNAGVKFNNNDSIMAVPGMVDFIRCDSGSGTYRNERHHNCAAETTSTAIVRTGGASDGGTPISHQIVTTINPTAINFAPIVNFFPAIPMTIWNTVVGTNRNVTLYGIANDTRVPNNDEVWFDVEYLGDAASPKGLFAFGSKSNFLASGSALAADTSAWDSAATARANSTAYVIGNIIKVASNPGRIFFCTANGTSAGSEPGGYASAVDGGVVTDGSATFRAGCRFSQTLILSSPQPGLVGYLFVFPKFARASMTYFLDPLIKLS